MSLGVGFFISERYLRSNDSQVIVSESRNFLSSSRLGASSGSQTSYGISFLTVNIGWNLIVPNRIPLPLSRESPSLTT